MEEINLYDLIRFYARKWLTIITAVMIGAIIGVVYTFFIQQPAYKSTATLLLVGTSRTSNQESVVLNNYVQLFESRRILEPVITDKNYNQSYDHLVANTTAENIKNTDIINVSITTSKPSTSKALLEAAIDKFRSEAKGLYGGDSIKINVVDAADAPSAPTNVNPIQQIGIAILAAFALVIVILFFIYDYKSAQSPNKKRLKPVKKQAPKNKKIKPKK